MTAPASRRAWSWASACGSATPTLICITAPGGSAGQQRSVAAPGGSAGQQRTVTAPGSSAERQRSVIAPGGKAGRQRCIDEFSWEKIAQETVEVYNQAIAVHNS